jgi:hypothetical protein
MLIHSGFFANLAVKTLPEIARSKVALVHQDVGLDAGCNSGLPQA